MDNIRVVSEPRASSADVDFVREGLSLFNVAATGPSYYSPLAIFLRDGRDFGYEVIADVPDYPAGHTYHVLTKMLA